MFSSRTIVMQLLLLPHLPHRLNVCRRLNPEAQHGNGRKNYAVGLEKSCPGGAYYWAPEIPSATTIAAAMPAKYELVHSSGIVSDGRRAVAPFGSPVD